MKPDREVPKSFARWYWHLMRTNRIYLISHLAIWGSMLNAFVVTPSTVVCALYCLCVQIFCIGYFCIQSRRERKRIRRIREAQKHLDFFFSEIARTFREWESAKKDFDKVAQRDAKERYEIARHRLIQETEKIYPGFIKDFNALRSRHE